MSTTPTPQPISATVCSVCKEPWDRHVKNARYPDGYNALDYVHLDVMDRPKPPDRIIDVLTCIKVLQTKNQGLTGPVGAAGRDGKTQA